MIERACIERDAAMPRFLFNDADSLQIDPQRMTQTLGINDASV